nr:MAG TPA: hypothetical protein [Caudoviricetes sp.]
MLAVYYYTDQTISSAFAVPNFPYSGTSRGRLL